MPPPPLFRWIKKITGLNPVWFYTGSVVLDIQCSKGVNTATVELLVKNSKLCVFCKGRPGHFRKHCPSRNSNNAYKRAATKETNNYDQAL